MGVNRDGAWETLAEFIHAILLLEILAPPNAGSDPDPCDADEYYDNHNNPFYVRVNPKEMSEYKR